MAVLEVNGLKKVYTTRFCGSRVQALTNVTFAVERGEYVAITVVRWHGGTVADGKQRVAGQRRIAGGR